MDGTRSSVISALKLRYVFAMRCNLSSGAAGRFRIFYLIE